MVDDIRKVAFNRENLFNLLGVLDRNEDTFTHAEFADWCGRFWSEWRRGSDLFDSTDEHTINIVDNIYRYHLENRVGIFKNKKINEWIQSLDEEIDSRN